MPRFLTRLRSLFRRRKIETDLHAEFQYHLEREIEEGVAAGLTPEQARRRAQLEMGAGTQNMEECREMRGVTAIENFLRDLRYALRAISRNPGTSAVIALSIGLGIAANSTMFSVVNAVLFGALPVREPERLVVVVRDGNFILSYPDLEDFRNTGVFEGLAGRFPIVPASLAGERVWGQTVTANFFDVVGIRMAHGRGFLPREDEVQDRDAVVVLSHGLWTRRFGADPSIVGRTVAMNQRRFTVVGVTQPGFRGTDRMLVSEFWVPLRIVGALVHEMRNYDRFRQRTASWLFLEGRLKAGVSKQQAVAALQTVGARIDKEVGRDRPRPMSLETAGKWAGVPGMIVRGVFAGVMFVAALVLVIACANVANLLLARASSRQKEFNLRLALGATRGRLIRQLLTESVTLALLGASLGLGISYGLLGLLSQVSLPVPLPVEFNFAPDVRVLMFTTGLALGAGILFGLAPALRATRTDLVRLGPPRRLNVRNVLVVVQVALSLVLLATGMLFLRSLRNATRIDLGIQTKGIFSASFDPNMHSMEIAAKRAFLSQLQRRLEAHHAVEATAFVDVLPLSIVGSSTTTTPGHRDDVHVDPTYFQASHGYLRAMGIPLLKGRDFSPAPKGNKEAIIDEAVAAKLFPDREAIGSTMRAERDILEVIGVARQAKARTVGEDSKGVIYVNLDQTLDEVPTMTGITMVVKTRGAQTGAFTQTIRNEIAALDPNLAVFRTATMDQQVEQAFLLPQVAAKMSGAFGAVGLTLTAIGLFGVLSFAVRRRTREIGIRMALGAERSRVLRMVIGEGLTLVAVGLALGLPAAAGLARLMSSLLYGMSPTDWLTFTSVPAFMLAVGALAAWMPARIASRVDPTVALRSE